MGIFVKHCGGGHNLAILAIPALGDIGVDPGFLHRMKRFLITSQSFKGDNPTIFDVAACEQAGAGCDAVQVNGTGAADANPTAIFRTQNV